MYCTWDAFQQFAEIMKLMAQFGDFSLNFVCSLANLQTIITTQIISRYREAVGDENIADPTYVRLIPVSYI